MPSILQPIVAINQQLIRAEEPSRVQPMVVNLNKKDFGKRLNEALDHAGFPKDRDRRKAVSKHFNVSVETVRKWMSGESLPKVQRILEIANYANVQSEWLATGKGQKHFTLRSNTPNEIIATANLSAKEQFVSAIKRVGVTDDDAINALWNLARQMSKDTNIQE